MLSLKPALAPGSCWFWAVTAAALFVGDCQTAAAPGAAAGLAVRYGAAAAPAVPAGLGVFDMARLLHLRLLPARLARYGAAAAPGAAAGQAARYGGAAVTCGLLPGWLLIWRGCCACGCHCPGGCSIWRGCCACGSCRTGCSIWPRLPGTCRLAAVMVTGLLLLAPVSDTARALRVSDDHHPAAAGGLIPQAYGIQDARALQAVPDELHRGRAAYRAYSRQAPEPVSVHERQAPCLHHCRGGRSRSLSGSGGLFPLSGNRGFSLP